MAQMVSTSHKTSAVAVRILVLSLLTLMLATSLGACVYPYGGGEREGWHHGERGGERGWERGGHEGGERR